MGPIPSLKIEIIPGTKKSQPLKINSADKTIEFY